MSKIAVVFWSGTGNTAAMAKAVEEGAKAAGADVTLFSSDDFTTDMVGQYDAIALGGMVNPYVGSISTFVLIYFCVKMHKFAKEKIVAQIERDRNSFNA